MKTPNCFLTILILVFCSCFKIFGQTGVVGIYINKSEDKILTISHDKTFVLKNNINFGELLPIWKIDTISFGNWKLNNNFILLSSPDSISNNIMRLDVEEFVRYNVDTLELTISNQYENFFRSFGGERIFKYLVYIDSRDNSIGKEISMNNKELKIFFPKTDILYGIKIWIIPDPFLFPGSLEFNYLQTEYVSVKNKESNFLKVSIPNFTLNYINYTRFSNEYVIVKKNKLILRGEIFKRIND